MDVLSVSIEQWSLDWGTTMRITRNTVLLLSSHPSMSIMDKSTGQRISTIWPGSHSETTENRYIMRTNSDGHIRCQFCVMVMFATPTQCHAPYKMCEQVSPAKSSLQGASRKTRTTRTYLCFRLLRIYRAGTANGFPSWTSCSGRSYEAPIKMSGTLSQHQRRTGVCQALEGQNYKQSLNQPYNHGTPCNRERQRRHCQYGSGASNKD